MAKIETIRKVIRKRLLIRRLETIAYTLLAVCYALLFVYVWRFVV